MSFKLRLFATNKSKYMRKNKIQKPNEMRDALYWCSWQIQTWIMVVRSDSGKATDLEIVCACSTREKEISVDFIALSAFHDDITHHGFTRLGRNTIYIQIIHFAATVDIWSISFFTC